MTKLELINKIKNIDKKSRVAILLSVIFIIVFISAYSSSIFNMTRAERIIQQSIGKTTDEGDTISVTGKTVENENVEIIVISDPTDNILKKEAEIPEGSNTQRLHSEPKSPIKIDIVEEKQEEEVLEKIYLRESTAEIKQVADIAEEPDAEVSEKTTLRDLKPEKTSVVDVEKFEVKRVDSEDAVEVSFNLANRTEDNSPVSGHVFVFASKKDDKDNFYGLWPPTEHIEGVPQNYNDGDKFMMRYFITKKGKISIPEKEGEFDHFTIIVYSEDGELILNKEVGI